MKLAALRSRGATERPVVIFLGYILEWSSLGRASRGVRPPSYMLPMFIMQ